MEQNMIPILSKKFLKIFRIAYFMLRKGISKGKILSDLNIMMKRGKIAWKFSAIRNLMFHHHNHNHRSENELQLSFPTPLNEYEFSCSKRPAFRLPFHLNMKKNKHSHTPPLGDDLLAEALEIFASATSSPALPGFGPSSMVRQLRITDSPYPIQDFEEDNHVNEAAEEFITKFYRDLKRQNLSS